MCAQALPTTAEPFLPVNPGQTCLVGHGQQLCAGTSPAQGADFCSRKCVTFSKKLVRGGGRSWNKTPSKGNPVGKGLGVEVNAAGSRSCTSLTGHRDEEVDRSLLSGALGAMLWCFNLSKGKGNSALS